VKGYSSLLILKRIFRTIASDSGIEGSSHYNLPCDVFDLNFGTSTGGLIAIMLCRLYMSIDDCLEQYETTSSAVFGHPVSQSKLGKVFKKLSSGSFYDLAVLKREMRPLIRAGQGA
jgi:patatin-like phospholipase/acyl hydrolase